MTETKAKKVKKDTVVDGIDALNEMIARAKKAQEIYSTFTQEQVDKIFKAAVNNFIKVSFSFLLQSCC